LESALVGSSDVSSAIVASKQYLFYICLLVRHIKLV
jgi:hypothetical protein